MHFKTLLDNYQNKLLTLAATLIYVHEKGFSKASQKIFAHSFQFSSFSSYRLYSCDLINYNISDQQLIALLKFLTNFGFQLENITLNDIVSGYKEDCLYFLIDYLLENNLLKFSLTNSDRNQNLEALGVLSVEYFQKLQIYFNFDLFQLYGENQATLYFSISNLDLVDYLYSEGVDLFYDLEKREINNCTIAYILEKYDLSKISDLNVFYHIFYILEDSDLINEDAEKGEIVYQILINYILAFEKQDLAHHAHLLINLEAKPILLSWLKRYVEEGIEFKKVFKDFLEIGGVGNMRFYKNHFYLLKDFYKFNITEEKIDLKEIIEECKHWQKGLQKIGYLSYHACYLLYLSQNIYLEENLDYFISVYFMKYLEKELRKRGISQFEQYYENFKKMLLISYEKRWELDELLRQILKFFGESKEKKDVS